MIVIRAMLVFNKRVYFMRIQKSLTVSKTFLTKSAAAACWNTAKDPHYTGIGTEVRENYFGGALENAKVVVNMPQGLGRYGADDAVNSRGNGRSFEWYLKNHLGSTMLVYGTQWVDDENLADVGAPLAAYDYRATVVAMRTKQQVAKCCPPFGEQVDLAMPTDKVTENFTGKEKDDETDLNYFGARYLDPMLGMWISVDPARQFSSPYLYAGNGVNPVNGFDPDGNVLMMQQGVSNEYRQGVADAIAYLNARGAAGEIASLHFKSML